MKAIAIGFAVVVSAVASYIAYVAWTGTNAHLLNVGTFLVLSLTLIVLIWYAYDTNSIARITRDRWMREGVLGATYELQLVGDKGEVGRTLVRINNPTPLVVRARVNCNFRVYGERVMADPLYCGGAVWLVFPQQVSQGWFEIDSLLQKKGKNVLAMIAESSPANRKEQLTMALELEFWDELKSRRTFPQRSVYFDFERWAWIPELAEATET